MYSLPLFTMERFGSPNISFLKKIMLQNSHLRSTAEHIYSLRALKHAAHYLEFS